MTQTATDAHWLCGKQVTFTGRLAALTRSDAARLVEENGGAVAGSVSRQTDYLIVGQDGGHLNRSGGLSSQIQKARRLQGEGSPITIMAEDEMLFRLGADADGGNIHRRYSLAQLCRLLRVSRDRIRGWVRAGLIQPVEVSQRISYFDYRQVTWAKSLCELTRSGVRTDQIRRSLEKLRKWLPDVEGPLDQLVMLEENGRLLIRLENGLLADSNGQPHFEFADRDSPSLSLAAAKGKGKPERTAEEWFYLGCDRESAGLLPEAAEAYRQALLAGGPDAAICFNLANTLYAMGQKEPAAERFRQALEMDAASAETWNNLGVVLSDLGQCDEAIRAFHKVLELDPGYVDVHYNVADTLELMQRSEEAKPHWQAYLRHDPTGPWAAYARKRIGKGVKS